MLASHSLCGQANLTGTLIDSLTREPLPNAHVYFAGTSIGTTTGLEGEFTIEDIPEGKYELIASFLGYTTIQRPIQFRIHEKHELILKLVPAPVELDGGCSKCGYYWVASEPDGIQKVVLR